MRMSVEKGDPGYINYIKEYESNTKIEVFLDGEKLGYCFMADEEMGEAIVAELDCNGAIIIEWDKVLKKPYMGK